MLATFSVVDENFLRVYGLVVPPTLLVYLAATYWLFPTTRPGSFLGARFVVRMLTMTLACAFPFAALLMRYGQHDAFVWVVGCCWVGQVVVTVPLAWLLYRQQQDKLLQLRGIEQQLVQSAADLHRLRTQINPHFLFNALNTLYGTALKEHAEDTVEGVQRLGDMMRFMLEDNLQEFIAVEREISYLNNYIALQKLRTPPSPTMCIEASIPSLPCPHQIAPMLLLPFVENALKHGISHKGPSWVRIHLSCDEQHFRFEVRNSLHFRSQSDKEKQGMGIGLRNVEQRLQLLYGARHQLSCREEGAEFVVQLVLPAAS